MKPRFKPLERPEGEDVWFCQAPAQKSEHPTSAFNKALSQIPDLNNGKDISHLNNEQPKKSARGTINPNDTKYIRLAKAGGRKHLLTFTENPEGKRSPQPYPVPEWYGHCDYETVKRDDGVVVACPPRPDWMTHLENTYPDEIPNASNPYNPGQDIIAWDKMSTWRREEVEKTVQDKAKSAYNVQRKKKQNKIVNHKNKVNISDTSSKKEKLKLPNIAKSQLNGFRKLSGTELATQWYKKWYLIGQ